MRERPMGVSLPACATDLGLERGTPPVAAQLFSHASAEITAVAEQLWPSCVARLGPQLPSITNYVRVVCVDRERFCAKYSFLGTSLVSVLRGTRGAWPEVLAGQRQYLQRPGTLLAREAEQLELLARWTPLRVPDPVVYRQGVLITPFMNECTSLTSALLAGAKSPQVMFASLSDELLAFTRVEGLAGRVSGSAVAETPHTHIPSVFQRKFRSPDSIAYLNQLGTGWFPPGAQPTVSQLLRDVVERLSALRSGDEGALGQNQVAYGDLKPEHVLFVDGTRPMRSTRGCSAAPGPWTSRRCSAESRCW